MNILVTGATGNIGKWVVGRLVEEGHHLRCMDVTGQVKSDQYEYVSGDVRNLETLRRAAYGMDAAVHLAAIAFDMPRMDDQVLDVNIHGTYNLLLAAQESGVRRIVNFSSINALGQSEANHPGLYLPLDDQVPHYNVRNYSLSKHIGEELCASFAARGSLSAVSLRPTAVLDPNMKNLWAHLINEEVQLQADKNDFYSYVDVRDVAEAVVLALRAEINGHQAFLLTSNETRRRVPSAELVEKHFNHLPWKYGNKEEYLARDTYISLVDCTEAKRVLGWNPVHSQFKNEGE